MENNLQKESENRVQGTIFRNWLKDENSKISTTIFSKAKVGKITLCVSSTPQHDRKW